MQRALLQFSQPRNYDLVHEALVKAGREDLIGFGPRCLIKPRGEFKSSGSRDSKNKSSRGDNRSSKGRNSRPKKYSSNKNLKNTRGSKKRPR